MKVTKAQANRARVGETASALFCERGDDGVSIADLMASAGCAHGRFYKRARPRPTCWPRRCPAGSHRCQRWPRATSNHWEVAAATALACLPVREARLARSAQPAPA